MSQENIPSLSTLRGEPWTEWLHRIEYTRDPILSQTGTRHMNSHVSLLRRKDILLFGSCPKMDVKVICQCEKCSKVMVPTAFVSHSKGKHGPDQVHSVPVIPPGTSLLKKNKYAHSKNKKKSILPPPVPPPPLFPKQITSTSSPVITNPATADIPPPILLPIQTTKSLTTPPSSPTTQFTTNNNNIVNNICGVSNISSNSNSSNTSSSGGGGGGSNSSSLSRHKKSKKNYKKIKEYDPDKHCGVVDGHRGPCLRSITCSSHMVHLRKAVQGRSKDFHQLIVDHKTTKEKEVVKMNPGLSLPILDDTVITTSPCSTFRSVTTTFVKISPASKIFTTTTSTMTPKPDLQKVSQPLHVKVDTHVKVDPHVKADSNVGKVDSQVKVEPHVKVDPEVKVDPQVKVDSHVKVEPHVKVDSQIKVDSVVKMDTHVKVLSPVIDNSSSQGNIDTPTSVMYMPMSPVAVVSPIQFVQLGGPILRVASTQPVLSPPLATQPIVVTIPVQNNNATMYTTHPKPLIMTSCSTRKVGGTFVLQNQRIDRQRSEIQIAAKTRRSITNSCALINTHHKPNILKNSTRGNNLKLSTVKRQATDKVVNDNKHIRLNDVNGFILHADVNEASEAPQTNNSVHEKVTFINMK